MIQAVIISLYKEENISVTHQLTELTAVLDLWGRVLDVSWIICSSYKNKIFLTPCLRSVSTPCGF